MSALSAPFPGTCPTGADAIIRGPGLIGTGAGAGSAAGCCAVFLLPRIQTQAMHRGSLAAGGRVAWKIARR
ncbi:hypothetical protein [Hydrogenophaga sp. PAMC20947]|uniref:hypothetical protein n=1 Tax=Hydrogenophaga sp. PAMC20947 TaxID=2565558 RepID=UPI00109E32C3|nr:hypothetical protein [Hydrogenophaga sp. PAMC20947]QCB48155.1 hypothetical protein E5678_20275 [Hydrogenophaga sp. PAMC20947]